MARTPLNASALNDFDQRVKNAVPGFVQKTWNDSPPSLDTAGLQAEIDAASALWSAGAGRQPVFFTGDANMTYTASTVQPSGAGNAYVYGLLMKSGVELIGVGRARLLTAANPNTTLAAIKNPTDTTITVTAGGTTNFPTAGQLQFVGVTDQINYTGKTSNTFTGCSAGTSTIPNGTAVALNPKSTLVATHQTNLTTDWAIRNVTFDLNSTVAIETEQHSIFTGPVRRFEITDCEFTNSHGKAIFLYGDNLANGQTQRYRISGNYFHDISSNAIHPGANGAADYLITDNRIFDERLTGGAESIISGALTTFQRGIITGNIIRNWGTMDVGGRDMLVDGNYINQPASSAAAALKIVGPGPNIRVTNNTVDCSAATSTLVVGISLQDGNLSDVIVQGNTIVRNATSTAARGISFNSTNSRVLIADNIITGGTAAAEADISGNNLTDSIVRNNVCQSTAFGMFVGNSCSRILIEGNICTSGSLIADCTDSTVANNRVVAQAGNTTALEVNGNSVVTGNRVKSAAISGSAGALRVFGTDSVITGNYLEQSAATNQRIIDEQTGADRNLYADNQFIGTGTLGVNLVGAASKVRRNTGYISEASGATSVADGGTVTHGLAATPTRVNVTPSIGSQMVSVTAKTATTFTVAIKTDAGGVGTTQTVYWQAEI